MEDTFDCWWRQIKHSHTVIESLIEIDYQKKSGILGLLSVITFFVSLTFLGILNSSFLGFSLNDVNRVFQIHVCSEATAGAECFNRHECVSRKRATSFGWTFSAFFVGWASNDIVDNLILSWVDSLFREGSKSTDSSSHITFIQVILFFLSGWKRHYVLVELNADSFRK